MNPTGRVSNVPADQQLARGVPLDKNQFDTVFTGVAAANGHLVHTRLTDPSTGRVLTQSFDSTFTQCVVYTPPHRQAICIEPYTCVPDAIRLAAEGYETGLQVLAPGESRETTITITVSS